MPDITCRRTKWRKGDGTINYAPGYYYLDRGPFTSREKAEEYKDQREWAEKEESGENQDEQLSLEIENLRFWIKELESRVKKLEGIYG